MANASLASVLLQVRTRGIPNGAVPPTDLELLDRFARDRDEAAFAALVARHGRMVLGACRRILRDPHDAEDACQAAFLVLARKADSVRGRDSLAGWLHGVACRVARRLRADAARRDARRPRAAPPPGPDAAAEAAWREVRAVLDEELARLPERYRAALVLCYLEGLTQDEAARQLDWTVGAFRGRLERGRERLRARLARRGLSLGVALTAATLPEAPAAFPTTLFTSTVKAASIASAGEIASAAGVVPARIVALAEGVSQAITVGKAKAWVLALALALGAGSLAYHQAAAGPDDPPQSGRPVAAGKTPGTGKDLSTLQKKLVGTWVGTRGFVVPVLTVAADGTFRETVLNEASEGTWALEEGELPPTLVRRYTTAADPRLAGATTRVKVVGLDGEWLSFPNANDPLRTITYRRTKPAPQGGERAVPTGPPARETRLDRPAARVEPERRLVGTWVGHADRHGESYTFRVDGTYRQEVTLSRTSGAGTWSFDWGTLPPTLVLRVAESNDPAAVPGSTLRHKVVALDDKRLSFENPDAVDPLGGPRPTTYTRAKEAPPARGQHDPRVGRVGPVEEGPRRIDVAGEWRSDHGLAGVFFALDLKADGTFVLGHREVAPALDLVTTGTWALDGDRVELREERQVRDAKPVPWGGGVFFAVSRVDTLKTSRKGGGWVLVRGRDLEFSRPAPGNGEKPPG